MFPNQEECHAESLKTLQNEIKNVNISNEMAVVPGSNRNLKLQFFSVELREYVRGILKTAWSA